MIKTTIIRRAAFVAVMSFGLQLSMSIVLQAQRAGDEWTNTQGDESPGLSYDVAAATPSGKIIAAGSGGTLMISNDGGINWTFDQIRINGIPVFGQITTLYQVPGGDLMGVLVRLEDAPAGFFKYQVRSYLLSSPNEGVSWTMRPFPKTFATFRGNGRAYYGVHITGLHMGPGDELLAYGTVSGSNNLITLWSLGGVIFREAGGAWEQALFQYGPVTKIANANGRAVAAARSAILDSIDGAGWNGYEMREAQVILNGSPLDAEAHNRLRVIDVEVLADGTYVAQGGVFVPVGDAPNVETNFLDRSFKLSSPTPFSGARNWTAYEEPYHGPWTKVGNTIIAGGAGGVWITSSGGPGFTNTGPEVRAWGSAIAVSGTSNAVAVQSSETVWRSTNAGSSWTRVWDKEPETSLLSPLGYHDGILFARSDGDLWSSRDNGESWQKVYEDFPGYNTMLSTGDGRLVAPAGSRVVISGDGGFTWRTVNLTGEGSGLLVRTPTGRLIMPVRGRSVQNEGTFHVSDDSGETWSTRIAGLAWGEMPRAAVVTATGRVIVAANTFASFNPRLVYSDDNGDSWESSTVLQSLEGLDTVSGDPSTKVTEIKQLKASRTGRILAMDEAAIFTSDDNGDTWTVRVNLHTDAPGPLYLVRLQDVAQVGSRWIATGFHSLEFPRRGTVKFTLVSDDDGATWGLRPFETVQSNTVPQYIIEAGNRRAVITGTNGSVFISDGAPQMLPSTEAMAVREGGVRLIPVSRPDVDGAIDANYSTTGRTAMPDTDFTPVSGVLHWDAGEMEDKLIPIEMIDNTTVDGERILLLQVAFESSDGLYGQLETAIEIIDNDGANFVGIVLDGGTALYTSESGESAQLGIALQARTTQDVIIRITGLDESEGSLSQDTFTFTPSNWGTLQTLTLTGVDDAEPDGDVAYNLTLTVESGDQGYAGLSPINISVVNAGDEPIPAIVLDVRPGFGPGFRIVPSSTQGDAAAITGSITGAPDASIVVEGSPRLGPDSSWTEVTTVTLGSDGTFELPMTSLPGTEENSHYFIRLRRLAQ